ncbi:MAG TPA: tocopherol cyclase family protein [Candidatus Kapabacteria bacterium]|nr:tocopherol cyclase family protein [Candidatus Kapabacteria bacterium]
MLGIYKPTTLQGNLDRDKYFEGWFQKIYSKEYNASILIIYGYATRNTEDRFGFIQILLPQKAPEIIYFNRNEIACDSDGHIVQMGENLLTTEIILINTNDINVHLKLINNKVTRTFKNSMGYHYFVPNLPCYHSVLNTAHQVSGEIQQKDVRYILNNEMGYLEKNWGTSFPKSYIWLHAVDPHDSKVSMLFSIAEIKWFGIKFIKHVGHFHFDDKQIDLRSLKNFAVSHQMPSKDTYQILMRSKTIQIEISIVFGDNILFKGPQGGVLSSDIIHFPDTDVQIRFTENNKIRKFHLIGNFENIGNF